MKRFSLYIVLPAFFGALLFEVWRLEANSSKSQEIQEASLVSSGTPPQYVYPINLIEAWDSEDFYPSASLPNATQRLCNESKEILITTDHFGLRNESDAWTTNSEKILVVGDSFALGECVEANKTISGYLGNKGLSVLNLGSSGNGPMTSYMALKIYSGPITAKSVVWLFFEGNDFFDLRTEQKAKFFDRYLDESFAPKAAANTAKVASLLNQKLAKASSAKAGKSPTISVKKLIQFNETRRVLKQILRPWYIKLRHPEQAKLPRPSFATFSGVDDYLKVLDKALSFTTTVLKADFVFVYIPDPLRYSQDKDTEPLAVKDVLLKKVADRKISFIDLTTLISNESDAKKFYALNGTGHLNESGYELVAEEIEKLLQSRN